jgi:hypothetical protein
LAPTDCDRSRRSYGVTRLDERIRAVRRPWVCTSSLGTWRVLYISITGMFDLSRRSGSG